MTPAETPQSAYSEAYWKVTVAGICMAAERCGLGWCIYTDWHWDYNWI
jgi:hypothetical protein